MKILFFFLSIYSLTLVYCISPKKNVVEDDVIVSGHVEEIPDGEIYLVDAFNSKIVLDSTSIKKGWFKFLHRPDSNFIPSLVKLRFRNQVDTSYKQFFYVNDFSDHEKSEGKFPTMDAFYLEQGKIEIFSDESYQSSKLGIRVRIKAGEQTNIFYALAQNDLGWIGNANSSKRIIIINDFASQVKRHPNSYFLFQTFYNYRMQYSDNETMEILNLFDKNINSSGLATKIRTDLLGRSKPGSVLNFAFRDSKNKMENIIDTSFMVNMVVFWASWCSPCRKEIPLLKRLNSQYNRRGLRLINVSIDENILDWKEALKEEDMNWPQVIIEAKELDRVQQSFRFSAVPSIYFFNNKGIELSSLSGYEKNNQFIYERKIKEYLKLQDIK